MVNENKQIIEKENQFISEWAHGIFKKQAFWREDKSADPLQSREDCLRHLEVASAIHRMRHKPT